MAASKKAEVIELHLSFTLLFFIFVRLSHVEIALVTKCIGSQNILE